MKGEKRACAEDFGAKENPLFAGQFALHTCRGTQESGNHAPTPGSHPYVQARVRLRRSRFKPPATERHDILELIQRCTFSGLNWAPLYPRAHTIRPQLASLPNMAVFTSDDVDMAHAALRACS